MLAMVVVGVVPASRRFGTGGRGRTGQFGRFFADFVCFCLADFAFRRFFLGDFAFFLGEFGFQLRFVFFAFVFEFEFFFEGERRRFRGR